MEFELKGLKVEAKVSYTVQARQYQPARLEAAIEQTFDVSQAPQDSEVIILAKSKEILRRCYNAAWDQTQIQMGKYLKELDSQEQKNSQEQNNSQEEEEPSD